VRDRRKGRTAGQDEADVTASVKYAMLWSSRSSSLWGEVLIGHKKASGMVPGPSLLDTFTSKRVNRGCVSASKRVLMAPITWGQSGLRALHPLAAGCPACLSLL
jgi:hypothetical protein